MTTNAVQDVQVNEVTDSLNEIKRANLLLTQEGRDTFFNLPIEEKAEECYETWLSFGASTSGSTNLDRALHSSPSLIACSDHVELFDKACDPDKDDPSINSARYKRLKREAAEARERCIDKCRECPLIKMCLAKSSITTPIDEHNPRLMLNSEIAFDEECVYGAAYVKERREINEIAADYWWEDFKDGRTFIENMDRFDEDYEEEMRDFHGDEEYERQLESYIKGELR